MSNVHLYVWLNQHPSRPWISEWKCGDDRGHDESFEYEEFTYQGKQNIKVLSLNTARFSTLSFGWSFQLFRNHTDLLYF